MRLFKKKKSKSDIALLASCLERLKGQGFQLGTVIDVGASDGRWSKQVQPFYPDARYHLIEANSYHLKGLRDYEFNDDRVSYVLAAAGDIEGEIAFDTSDPFGGVASYESSTAANMVKVPVTSIDTEVEKNKLNGPFFIKLDTHGFEVPILEGAAETLEQTDLVLIETYNFKIQENSLRFWEMCALMEEKGFRPIDLMEPMFRPKDGALWQFDIFFARCDSSAFSSSSYA
jgi:FkbM family methyltransferase